MEGFGFPFTRFFTSENEWRYTGVYEPTGVSSIVGRPLDDAGKMAILEWDEGEMGLKASTDFGELDLPAATLQDQWLRTCTSRLGTAI